MSHTKYKGAQTQAHVIQVLFPPGSFPQIPIWTQSYRLCLPAVLGDGGGKKEMPKQ